MMMIITNLKKQPITIVRVLTKEKDQPLVELSTQGFDLPETINYQKPIFQKPTEFFAL